MDTSIPWQLALVIVSYMALKDYLKNPIPNVAVTGLLGLIYYCCYREDYSVSPDVSPQASRKLMC